MKTSILAAVAVLGLIVSPAFAAGEGNGNPFPNNAGSYSVQTMPAALARLADRMNDSGSESYPATANRPGSDLFALNNGALLPQTGSETSVQAANSLPRNFEQGAVAYAQAISVQTWVAAHAAQPHSIYAASIARLHTGG